MNSLNADILVDKLVVGILVDILAAGMLVVDILDKIVDRLVAHRPVVGILAEQIQPSR